MAHVDMAAVIALGLETRCRVSVEVAGRRAVATGDAEVVFVIQVDASSRA